MDEDIPCKWKSKKAGDSFTYIRKNRNYVFCHYTVMKGLILQEVIAIVIVCHFNISVQKYIKQILKELKGRIDCNTVIVMDFQ